MNTSRLTLITEGFLDIMKVKSIEKRQDALANPENNIEVLDTFTKLPCGPLLEAVTTSQEPEVDV